MKSLRTRSVPRLPRHRAHFRKLVGHTVAPAVAVVISVSMPLFANAAGTRVAAIVCLGQPATIVGTPGDDRLNGTPGNDVIHGGTGNDRIDGRGGNDVICGGDGADNITGGPGIDILDGGPGDDTLSGGAGRDVATYANAPLAVRVDLRRHQATGWSTDRLTGVETILGSRFGDVLIGDGGNNHLAGAQGDDRLYGLGGDDLLDGGAGTDLVDGGAGADYCIRAERSSRCP